MKENYPMELLYHHAPANFGYIHSKTRLWIATP